LSPEALLGFCVLVLFAGNETTTNLLGNLLLCFDEHPEVVERLRQNRVLVSGAIEEALRYSSPVKTLPRVTTTETVLGDQRIGPDQFIVVWLGSANRDEAEFPDPDRFDMEREPGYGSQSPDAHTQANARLCAEAKRGCYTKPRKPSSQL